MTRLITVMDNVTHPLECSVEALKEATYQYTEARHAYEEEGNPHSPEITGRYQLALLSLRLAHVRWKALFSELTQARRL